MCPYTVTYVTLNVKLIEVVCFTILFQPLCTFTFVLRFFLILVLQTYGLFSFPSILNMKQGKLKQWIKNCFFKLNTIHNSVG